MTSPLRLVRRPLRLPLRRLALPLLAVLAAACAADDQGSGSCPMIAGTWAVRYSRDPQTPGDCPTTLPSDTFTIESSGEIRSAQFGGPCKGKLDGCKLTATCTTKFAGGTAQWRAAFTFSGRDVTGAVATGLVADTGESCTENLTLLGQRN